MRVLPMAVLLACTWNHHRSVLGLFPAAMNSRPSLNLRSPSLGSKFTHATIRVGYSSPTLLNATPDEEQSSSAAGNILKMVEEISNGQFSLDVVSKMTELEKALTAKTSWQ